MNVADFEILAQLLAVYLYEIVTSTSHLQTFVPNIPLLHLLRNFSSLNPSSILRHVCSPN